MRGAGPRGDRRRALEFGPLSRHNPIVFLHRLRGLQISLAFAVIMN